ncbi:OmpA family protein [Stenotrophobium rhamnosiphilum]|uniref:Flagellar motor protein MotB n=1 Tax=Stenotrophobium rhamnosiphilum TaxID=2029166 RepID=A0A2T5MK14_9GAMM|nr:OmpA family protein [Stenotrophobium rhamnosiphilum]PTU32889.1 flagellar motor protein MotB [Stenotrophobium rhamnosiphilum]
MSDFRLGYPERTLVALGAFLTIVIVTCILPLRSSVSMALALTVFGSALILIFLRTQRQRRAQHQSNSVLAALGASTVNIPAALRNHMPLIMMIGDSLESIFSTDPNSSEHIARVKGGAIWLRVNRTVDLPKLCSAVYTWRDSRAPNGVILTITPDLHTQESLDNTLHLARQVLSDSSRLLGKHLSAYLAVYQKLTRTDEGAYQWVGLSSANQIDNLDSISTFLSVAEAPDQNIKSDVDARPSAWRAAGMTSLVRWTQKNIISSLLDRRQTSMPWPLHGIAWIDCGPATKADSPWNLHLQSQTCLSPALFTATTQPWPLPEPFLETLPQQQWVSPRIRALTHAIVILACLGVLATWGAVKNNDALMTSVSEDINRFYATPVDQDSARRDALAALTKERDRLDRYQRIGTPIRLDLGMYRGDALVPELNRAIASYQPPAQPPAVITLDGLSLFESSSAELKSGSTRALISVLDVIKAHPGKRILIAGHTDSSGDAEKNQRLSEERAGAVRHWLMETSGLPVSTFAIQGYGGGRPITDNTTAEGRARNRRVEITLIPETTGT